MTRRRTIFRQRVLYLRREAALTLRWQGAVLAVALLGIVTAAMALVLGQQLNVLGVGGAAAARIGLSDPGWLTVGVVWGGGGIAVAACIQLIIGFLWYRRPDKVAWIEQVARSLSPSDWAALLDARPLTNRVWRVVMLMNIFGWVSLVLGPLMIFWGILQVMGKI